MFRTSLFQVFYYILVLLFRYSGNQIDIHSDKVFVFMLCILYF